MLEYTPEVGAFFAFMRERHAIYLRRHKLGMPRPWTSDPILAKYRFTNVFRELDKTTIWFRENVRDPYRDSPTVILATLVFRLFNRIETGRALFGQGDFFDSSPFNAFAEAHFRFPPDDPHRVVADLKAAITAGVKAPGPYVTGSYIIKTPEGMSKLDGVLWIIAEALRGEMKVRGRETPGRASLYDWATYMIETDEPVHLQTATGWLERLPYIGHFTAYEMVSDLRWTRLLERAPDIESWANPGPGCRRGLKRVVGGGAKVYIGDDTRILELMRGLLEESRLPRSWPQLYWRDGGREYYSADGYALPTGPEGLPYAVGEPANWPRFEMREIEHSLCEFDKYERARLGEGRPRGVL